MLPQRSAAASPVAGDADSVAFTEVLAATGAAAVPVVVSVNDGLTGAVGAQVWGGLKASATSWGGAAAVVSTTPDGPGVQGGRFAGQIDHNGATGASEILRIEFPAPVDTATLRIARMNPAENGPNAEVGAWKAYDAAGALVGEGLLDPRGRTAVAQWTYDFAIDPTADLKWIELTGRPYNNGSSSRGGGDSSDFALARVTYTPTSEAEPTLEGPPPGAVVVKVGADIQALVNSAGEGAVFWIKAGEHRMQAITPKAGQQFIGEEGAILNGSRELTGFVSSGSVWYVGGQTQEGARRATGEGTSGFDRAGYPDAVYLDDKPLLHVDTLQEVRSGTYYFDYAADRIYIGDNPAGHQVEAAVRAYAFKGAAAGVTVANLVVEKYAAPAQGAAIGGSDGSLPVDWTIRDNEVRLNYGVGIKVRDGSEVIGNHVHDNGQMGVAANGKGVLFADNEIAANGFWSGLNVYWEGGGSKFALTDGLVVRDNHVHDNKGMGLWTDINNINTLYEGNRVERNSGAGISHEISYDAIVRNNTLVGNGFADANKWLWGGGIQIQNSSNVEVYGNTVDMTDGGNGITLVQQQRGTGAYGPWVTEGNHVHDNMIIDRTPGQGKIGAVADWDWAGMNAGGNLFDHNQYRLNSVAEADWAWGGQFRTWDNYRATSGWDAHSTLVLV